MIFGLDREAAFARIETGASRHGETLEYAGDFDSQIVMRRVAWCR